MTSTALTKRPGTRPEPRPADVERKAVTLIPGDGVGMEVMGATVRVVEAAGARVDWEVAEAGERVARKGVASGLPAETLDSAGRTGVVLRGPFAPRLLDGRPGVAGQLRRTFGAYAVLRPARAFPGTPAAAAGRPMDVLVVHDCAEVSPVVEHMPTFGTVRSTATLGRAGFDRLVRTAYELASGAGRARLHHALPPGASPLAGAMLRRHFDEISAGYPDVCAETIDAGEAAARLAAAPEELEALVAAGVHGELLAAAAAAHAGGAGFVPAVALGPGVAAFETVHGPAADRVGRGAVNPVAALRAAVLMLRHLGDEAADTVEHALALTLEQGVRPPDASGPCVGTHVFTEAVLSNLGRRIPGWRAGRYAPPGRIDAPRQPRLVARRVVGVDVFLDADAVPEWLVERLQEAASATPLELVALWNRGTAVYPPGEVVPEPGDFWRARFEIRDPFISLDDSAVSALLWRIGETDRWVHVEKLMEWNGVPGFTSTPARS